MDSEFFISQEFNDYQTKLIEKMNTLIMSYGAQAKCGEWTGALKMSQLVIGYPSKLSSTDKVKAKTEENIARFQSGFIKRVAFNEKK